MSDENDRLLSEVRFEFEKNKYVFCNKCETIFAVEKEFSIKRNNCPCGGLILWWSNMFYPKNIRDYPEWAKDERFGVRR